MHLAQFRVQKFRNILDTGMISTESDVTCLVGKNEAGKSALIEALYLLNPAYEEEFDVAAQFPAWKAVQERRTGDPGSVVPITAIFELDENDIAQVESFIGVAELRSPELTVERTYSGMLRMKLDINEKPIIEALLSDKKNLPNDVKSASTLEQLNTVLDQLLEQSNDNWPMKPTLERIQAGIEDPRPSDLAVNALKDRIPKFFRFTNTSIMPGTVSLDKLANLTSDTPGKGGLQAVKALVSLAGSEANALGMDDYEARKQELRTVSIDLTNQVFEYWRQNRNLRVDFDIEAKDGQAPDGGRQIVEQFLHIRVDDTRTGYGNNFRQRSFGFKWFFSFFAAFTAFEESDEHVVILLDEPGLSLHGKAQHDFLRFIDERLAPIAQVIYTTHSPFMVRAGELERVRTVEDLGPDAGGVAVHADATARDPDSLFPLQAALGYDLAQHLFVGTNNLVVEGSSELIYFDVLSDMLDAHDRECLDPHWRVLPAGGATNIPTMVGLIGPHLDVTVVTDAQRSRVAKLQNAVRNGLLKESRLIILDQVVEAKEADIEDLFSVDDYLDLFNRTFGTNYETEHLEARPRITARIEEGFHGEFNHREPARYLLTHQGDFEFSEETLSNFEALFRKINATKAQGTAPT